MCAAGTAARMAETRWKSASLEPADTATKGMASGCAAANADHASASGPLDALLAPYEETVAADRAATAAGSSTPSLLRRASFAQSEASPGRQVVAEARHLAAEGRVLVQSQYF